MLEIDPSNLLVNQRGVFPMVGHVSTNQSTDKNQRVVHFELGQKTIPSSRDKKGQNPWNPVNIT